ncbi:MAG: hypothetical protein O2975_06080, partial [Proteobacteria bacterium]|nr:hypothetical protein [Pseudomonadota bacterium]
MRAVIRVTGTAGRFEDFRERIRWTLVREMDVEPYTEHHGKSGLEYRFAASQRLPFPAFAAATAEFEELSVEAEWDDAAQGLRCRATIVAGKLTAQESVPIGTGPANLWIELQAEGTLAFALAIEEQNGAWIGYCVDAQRHAYLRVESDALLFAADAGANWTRRNAAAVAQAIDSAELAALEALAFAFAEAWLWYDAAPLAETALERSRYDAHGWPVAGANLLASRRQELMAAG